MFISRGITKNITLYEKVKSDRVNFLRKQYDAFLEEDKKRKARNEYILGRLDTMRHPTTLVPVRHKPNTFSIHSVAAYHNVPRSDLGSATYPASLLNLSPRNIPVQNNEDATLIREISKNYILIPKLSSYPGYHGKNTTPVHNLDASQLTESLHDLNLSGLETSKPNENPDWKSKYEILNILKKDENEIGDSSVTTDKNEALVRKHVTSTDDNLKIYCNEIPEKDVSIDLNNQTFNNNAIQSVNNVFSDIPKECDTEEQMINMAPDPGATVTHEINNISKDFYYPEKLKLTTNQTNEYEMAPDTKNKTDDTLTIEATKTTNIDNVANTTHSYTEVSIAEPDQYTFMEQNHLEASQNIIMNNEIVNVENTNEFSEGFNENYAATDITEQVDYGELNVQELTSNEGPLQHDTLGQIQQYDLKQGDYDTAYQKTLQEPNQEYNTNPNNAEVKYEENYVNDQDIEDFEAEQRDMFYSENVDPVCQEEGSIAQGEEVQQNQDYNNYFEDMQRGSYPAAVNENDEVTQRYDPQYEQQYAEPNEINVPNDDSQMHETFPQVYDENAADQPSGYNQTQPMMPSYGHDQSEYEHQDYTLEYVQQTLDNEEGLVDNKEPVSKTQEVQDAA